MKKITATGLQLAPFQLLDQTWALLVAGQDQPNPMTVSWGGFGTLWNKPVIILYVRPTRYTFQLLNQHSEFSLNFLSERYRHALSLCGSKSGRNVNKWNESGLHALASETISVPRVQEAFLSFECRILAWQDFDPSRFLLDEIEKNYPRKDYHRIYWGEPLAIWSAEFDNHRD